MKSLKSSLIVIGWVSLGLVIAFLIDYIPAALGPVDDYLYGRAVARFAPPTAFVLFIAGMLFVNRRVRAALIVSGLVVVAHVALAIYLLMLISNVASRTGNSPAMLDRDAQEEAVVGTAASANPADSAEPAAASTAQHDRQE